MIFNRQRTVRVALRPLDAFSRRVKKELGLAHVELAVALVSDREIARMNRIYRKKSGPTDVLSFPAETRRRPVLVPVATGKRGVRKAAKIYLGDIAISPETARRNAAAYGRTLSIEMRILILHGVLHLLGYDHESDGGKMERLEALLRRKLGLR